MTPQPNNRFSPAIQHFVPTRAASAVKSDEFMTVRFSCLTCKLYEAFRNEYEGHEQELPAALAAPQIGLDKRIIVVATAAPVAKNPIMVGGMSPKRAMQIKFQTFINPEIVSSTDDRLALKFLNPAEEELAVDLDDAVAQAVREAMMFLDPVPAPELTAVPALAACETVA